MALCRYSEEVRQNSIRQWEGYNHMINPFFGPASEYERIVHGSDRPGYPWVTVAQAIINQWIDFMVQRRIERVVCLLPEKQLSYYPGNLLAAYRNRFGETNVCWAPIEDYHLAKRELLIGRILPFLAESDDAGRKTVIHCSGGSGRTGHVLAAWLVHAHGVTAREALDDVCNTGRNPFEAIRHLNATQDDLYFLLGGCRPGRFL